jgi:uncharacterized protein with PIN domain
MSRKELKPCPFCDEEIEPETAKININNISDGCFSFEVILIYCPSCGYLYECDGE